MKSLATLALNKQTTPSIIASDSFLADVARRCIERELMTRHADMLNAANEDSITDNWFISDRH